MDIIMSSPGQECSGMENGRADGAYTPSKSQKSTTKSHKRKSRASLESFDERKDNGNPESKVEVPRQNVNQKTVVSSSAATGDVQHSISRSETTNLDVTSTVQKKKKKKPKKRPTIGEILNPRCLEKKFASGNILNIRENTHDSKHANAETGLRTTATCDAKNEMLEKEKIAKTGSREEDAKVGNGETGPETIATRDAKSIVSESNGYVKIAKKKTASSRTTTIDAKTASKVEDCIKVGNSETGSSICTTPLDAKKPKRKKPTIGEILNPRYLEKLEIAEAKKLFARHIKKKESQGLNTHKNTEDKYIGKITSVVPKRKLLLIFDVNGLLADIVFPPPKNCKADKYIPKRAIFKRPFLDDFLSFCFERFHIAIWSSRNKHILDLVVDFLLGDLKKKLLFVWDKSSCMDSGVKTLENKHKCIVFKHLRKIWDKNGPNDSWVKGTFNESNTLLLDDSPYKALLNPKHTGVFPLSYTYKNTNDDALGPNGDLRNYLEGLAAAENMKTYVEQHPFGQGVIDETSPHWAFYSQVLHGSKKLSEIIRVQDKQLPWNNRRF